MDNVLSDDLLYCIFCYLSLPDRLSAEKVSRRWQRVMVPLWLEDIEFSVDRTLAECNREQLMFIINNHIQSKRQIRCIKNYGDTFQLQDILQHLRRIKGLNINGLTLSVPEVQRLSENCINLEELVLRVAPTVRCIHLKELFEKNIYLKHVHILGHYCRHEGICLKGLPSGIADFSLTSCHLYSTNFYEFTANLKSLKRIRFDYCFDVPLDFIERMMHEKPQLQILQQNFSTAQPHPVATNIFNFQNNITFLTLFNNSQLNDDMLVLICNTCPKLEHLLLGFLPFEINYANGFGANEENRSISLTARSISELGRLQHLRSLGLFSLSSENNDNLFLNGISRCSAITTLCLTTNSINVTDIACNVIDECRDLVTLVVLGYSFTRECLQSVYERVNEIQVYPEEQPRPTIALVVEDFSLSDEIINRYSHPLLEVVQLSIYDFTKKIQEQYI